MRLPYIWVVTNARKESTLADIVFRATPAGLIRQIRGGLSESEEPVFYAVEEEALAEGARRIEAYRAYRAVLDGEGGETR